MDNGNMVVTSSAMKAPDAKGAKKQYPKLGVPPAGHAVISGDGETLTYAGYDIISFRTEGEARKRLHSDGDLQSHPFIQQFILSAAKEMEAEITFTFPVELINMRPRRAQAGEAILGQVGNPLLPNINGLYAPDWDLLISWHGLDFEWGADDIIQNEDGWTASIKLKIGQRPLVLLLRPRYYSQHLGYAPHKPWEFKPDKKAVAGWCSWEAYHSKVTYENVVEAAKVLSPFIPYGLEYLQLDDGYQLELVPPEKGQTVCDSWTTTNEKFPGGHTAIVEAMRAGGFVPGIWTNAVVSNEEAARDGGFCLLDADGNPIRGAWIQYVLDCTDETLAKHVTPYYRKLREYGYEYFKSDALRHLIFDGLQESVRLGLMDEETAFARQQAYMRAAREGIGESAYYLSCWGVLTPSIGVCDACRVATDANPNWYAVSMQVRETARWFFAQRVLFTLDPDHVCVRTNLPWVRMILSLVSLSGGLYMISDKPESYDDARIEMIRRTLPPLTTRTAETGPIDYTTPACNGIRETDDWDKASRDISHIDAEEELPFGSLWATHFSRGGRRWCVVQRVAVVPLKACKLPVEKLALSPNKYYAYDFWAQRGLGCFESAIGFDGLALGETAVVGLTDVSGELPQLVGSDRHVSMDAVSVENIVRDGGRFSMRLKGFEGLKCRYAVYGASELLNVEGGTASVEIQGELLMIDVCFSADDMIVDVK